jgi:ketosteroid isomerase-like protein
VLGTSLWFGTATTLPFWGNRMNRASHLQVVLDIMDTMFILKCLFIMGGLTLTLVTGVLVTNEMGLSYFDVTGQMSWLGVSQIVVVLIALNSCVLLYLMACGRHGRRSYFRYVPAIGYNNIVLIFLVLIQMVVKPGADNLFYLLIVPLTLLALADFVFIVSRILSTRRLCVMSAQEFATHYFKLLKEEKMTDFFRLFHDDAEFIDPFALAPVRGIKAIEHFFQRLREQFDEIEISPVKVTGNSNTINTQWVARGVTKNGVPMSGLCGTNVMRRAHGRIHSVHIDFNLSELPPVQRVAIV